MTAPLFPKSRRTNRRWLLTSCVAGIAGSLIAGGALLGFLSNAASPNALGVDPVHGRPRSRRCKNDVAGNILDSGGRSPKPLPRRSPRRSGRRHRHSRARSQRRPQLSGHQRQDLPYGDGRTVVLDAELDIASVDSENITTITKSPPPEPVDELIKLTAGPRSSRTHRARRHARRRPGTALLRSTRSSRPRC